MLDPIKPGEFSKAQIRRQWEGPEANVQSGRRGAEGGRRISFGSLRSTNSRIWGSAWLLFILSLRYETALLEGMSIS